MACNRQHDYGDIGYTYSNRYGSQRRFFPYHVTHPLIFHVLTTFPLAAAGQTVFESLLSQDAVLAPGARRRDDPKMRSGFPMQSSLVFARDRAAGDDHYLFMTPGTVFDGHPFDRSIAIAYELDYLIDAADSFGFRASDLETAYTNLDPIWREADIDCPECDDYPDPKEQEACCEAARASLVSEQLEVIAAFGTLTGGRGEHLVRLYNEAFMFDVWDGFDQREWREAVRAATPEITEYEEYLISSDTADEDRSDEGNALSDSLESVAGLWSDFAGRAESPHIGRRGSPEFIFEGLLPLRCSVFYRDGSGNWHLTEELLDQLEVNKRQPRLPSLGTLGSSASAHRPIIYVEPQDRLR